MVSFLLVLLCENIMDWDFSVENLKPEK